MADSALCSLRRRVGKASDLVYAGQKPVRATYMMPGDASSETSAKGELVVTDSGTALIDELLDKYDGAWRRLATID